MEEKIVEFLRENKDYTKGLIKKVANENLEDIKVLSRKEALIEHGIDSIVVESGEYCYILNFKIEF